MTSLVLNVVALLLVLASCWIAMVWWGARMHRGRDEANEPEEIEQWGVTRVEVGDPCPECEGVGAITKVTGLEPCPLCEGTGVITSLPG